MANPLNDEMLLAEILAHIGKGNDGIWQGAARAVFATAGRELMRTMPGRWTSQDILEQFEKNASDINNNGKNDE